MESIVDLVKKHKKGIHIFPDNIGIVTGGFPCQDFSIAGKRKGFKSHKDHNGDLIVSPISSEKTRGKLYVWMKEVINITRPNIFIAENVKGLFNLGDVKEIIQEDFSQIAEGGYLVLKPQVLHAADYGVPQSRERVFFIGIKKSTLNDKALKALSCKVIPQEYNPYPLPTHSYSMQNKNLVHPATLKEVFFALKEPNKSEDISQQRYSKAKYMGAHCQGQSEVNLARIAPTIRAETSW